MSAEKKEPKEQEETETDSTINTVIPTGSGVIVVKDGKILVGTRKDNGFVCGPGGHIEIWELQRMRQLGKQGKNLGLT